MKGVRTISLVGFLAQATAANEPLSRDLSAMSGFNQTGQTLYGSPSPGVTDSIAYGASVTIAADSGRRLAIGAPLLSWNSSETSLGDINGDGIYFYQLNETTIDHPQWDLQWILESEEDEGIGHRLALSGDGSLVAIRRNASVELYKTLPTRTQLVNPIRSTGGDTVALSLDGHFLAISEETFRNYTGRVRIVDIDRSLIVSIPGVAIHGQFGWATSFSESGDRIAISAPDFANDDRAKRGLVRIYENAGGEGTWSRLGQNLVGSEAFEQFGSSLMLSSDGSTLVVGSPGSSGGGELRGKVTVYTFQQAISRWIPVGRFMTGVVDNDRFGHSVAISHNGSRIIASSHAHNETRGHVQVLDYEADENKWTLVDVVNGMTNMDRFGFAVSMTKDGSRLAVGAVGGRDAMAGVPIGKVQVFDISVNSLYPQNPLPSPRPSESPTTLTSVLPSRGPSVQPAVDPSARPSDSPSGVQSALPSVKPSDLPSVYPSVEASLFPSLIPSASSVPSFFPSTFPSLLPSASLFPSLEPSSGDPPPDSAHLKQVVSRIQYDGADEVSHFGATVSIASANGDRLVVGAPLTRFDAVESDDDPQGAVILYNLVDQTWERLWTFPGNTNEELGSGLAVSADGSRVVLRRTKPASVIEVYDVPANGIPILVNDSIPSVALGDSVALASNGAFLAVGQDTYQSNIGRVDVYSLGSGGEWAEAGSLFGNARTMRFGWATSFSQSGDRLAVSAPNFIGNGRARLGLVKVFERNGTSTDWVQIGQTLTGSEGGEQFGFSMELSGDGSTLVVGSPGSSGGGRLRGKVSMFVLLLNSTWVPLGNDVLGQNDTDRFGRSVAIDHAGLRIAATSYLHDARRGSLRMLELTNGESWTLLDEAEGGVDEDRLGFGVQGMTMSGDGSRVVVGSLRSNGKSTGSVVTLDVIVPTPAPSVVPSVNPTDDGIPIGGCLCDANRNCLVGAASVGSISLCLHIDAQNVSFLAVDQLRIIPADSEGTFFMPIVDGMPQIEGTQVEVEGSNCTIHTTLLSQYFEDTGVMEAEARGIALLRLDDGSLRRAMLDVEGPARRSSLFEIPMAVEGSGDETSGSGFNPVLTIFDALVYVAVIAAMICL